MAHARDREHDERTELKLGLAVVILSTIVGGSVFASLAANPSAPVKVFVGCLSVLAAIAAAVNQWTPFAGQSKAHSKAASEFGDVRRQLKDVSLSLTTERITPKEAQDKLMELEKRYAEKKDASPGVSDYDGARDWVEHRQQPRA